MTLYTRKKHFDPTFNMAEMKDESTHKKVPASSIEITDVLKGTRFEDDPESKELISQMKADLANVLESEAGQRLVSSVEKLGKKVIDEKSFSDVVKIIYHAVEQMDKSATIMVKVGFFLVGFGALVALVGSLPVVAEGALAIWVMRILQMIGGALMTFGAVPTLVEGIKKAWESVFSTPDPSGHIGGDSETDEEMAL